MFKLVKLFWKWLTASAVGECGHTARIKGVATIFGQERLLILKRSKGTVVACHSCIGKSAIVCGLCGNIIYPGDFIGVALPKVKDGIPQILENSLAYPSDTSKVIVCQRWSCMSGLGNNIGVLGLNKTIKSIVPEPLDIE